MTTFGQELPFGRLCLRSASRGLFPDKPLSKAGMELAIVALVTVLSLMGLAASPTQAQEPDWRAATLEDLRLYTTLGELQITNVAYETNTSGSYEELLFIWGEIHAARLTYYFQTTRQMPDVAWDETVSYYLKYFGPFRGAEWQRGERGLGETALGMVEMQRVTPDRGPTVNVPYDCIILSGRFKDAQRALSGFYCDREPVLLDDANRFLQSLVFKDVGAESAPRDIKHEPNR